MLGKLSKIDGPSRFPIQLCPRKYGRKRSRISYATAGVVVALIASAFGPAFGLSCYVCGGASGRACGEITTRRKSPYIRPTPVLSPEGEKQWEECNDLINNKGCIKQVVNDVVLLRGCWMQGNNQCLVDGTAKVCTCKESLCNESSGKEIPGMFALLIFVAILLWTS